VIWQIALGIVLGFVLICLLVVALVLLARLVVAGWAFLFESLPAWEDRTLGPFNHWVERRFERPVQEWFDRNWLWYVLGLVSFIAVMFVLSRFGLYRAR
jgi:hypothetical protein